MLDVQPEASEEGSPAYARFGAIDEEDNLAPDRRNYLGRDYRTESLILGCLESSPSS